MKWVFLTAAILLVALGFGYYRFHSNLLFDRASPIPPDPSDIKQINTKIQQIPTPSIYSVSDKIHVAIGYGFSNTVLLLGDQGNVIIDASRNEEAARAVKKEFEKLTNGKPLKAIICSLNYESCYGSSVFAEGQTDVQVWARETSITDYTRRYRKFDDKLFTTPRITVQVHQEAEVPQIAKNILSEDSKNLTIAGFNLALFHTPSELEDQISVWYADEQVLFSADVFNSEFQNHFAIRGTPARDFAKWVQSLDLLRNLRSKILIPSHTRPLFGAEFIYDTLTTYRDAVQAVHDQTIQLLNQNFSIDDIAGRIFLPPQVRENEFLKEFRATIPLLVRDVATFYVGFFNGVPADLFPLSPDDHAKELIELGGGFDATFEKASTALAQNKLQWALELSFGLFTLEPENPKVRELFATVLRTKADAAASNNGRNYYLTYLKTLQI